MSAHPPPERGERHDHHPHDHPHQRHHRSPGAAHRGRPGPAAAKNGADDPTTSTVSDDSTNRATTDDSATRAAADDSTNRIAADDNPGAGRDDRTNRASSKSQARKTTRGSCTAATDWKLKAKPRDGRLEVEFEVRLNVCTVSGGPRLSTTAR